MNRVSDIDIRLIKVFVVVAEAGGYSAAEPILNISTSTISLHMTNLEVRTGVRLCERGRGGFRLTERGKIIFEESKRLLNHLEDYSEVISSVRLKLAGRLSIGMVDCVVTHPHFPIPKAVKAFNKTDNEVKIELLVDSRQNLERDVVNGKIHAAIGPFFNRTAGLTLKPVYKERHELFCGQGHELFGTTPDHISTIDIADFPSISRLYYHDFDKQVLGGTSESATTYSMEAMLSLLLSGGYIGYLPVHYAQHWVDQSALHMLNIPDTGYDSEHALITKVSDKKSEALVTFLASLDEVIALGHSAKQDTQA